MLVPAKKRKRCPKQNSSRREVEAWTDYYDSEGNYTSLVRDNPVQDNLVEMVSATKVTRSAPEEAQVMITDLGRVTKESRSTGCGSNEPTQCQDGQGGIAGRQAEISETLGKVLVSTTFDQSRPVSRLTTFTFVSLEESQSRQP